ncbi:hypothetical protein AG1IA_04400 [Rhizoctonia solani AG-1 IA]|uniref:Uncharacterized protein n=1 Tax=Thanatephorus cucumeris (strain AG1-IA) TaxID=983506 RepID=L8WTU3_THACA|nr:hypothetical protein AG1IA_04400 [Rhizoctonia solani AG-1 IA]
MSGPSALPYPALHKDAKFVILSDWDGTITNFDSNDCGLSVSRRASNKEVLLGNITFRYVRPILDVDQSPIISSFSDSFREMLESVHMPFDECKELLKKSESEISSSTLASKSSSSGARPTMYRLSSSLGSGMEPLIRAVLSNLIGDEDAARIDIISNDVRFDADGSWHIVYRHPER